MSYVIRLKGNRIEGMVLLFWCDCPRSGYNNNINKRLVQH